jgi:hypothetical protein
MPDDRVVDLPDRVPVEELMLATNRVGSNFRTASGPFLFPLVSCFYDLPTDALLVKVNDKTRKNKKERNKKEEERR